MATTSIISNDGALASPSAVLEVSTTNPAYNQKQAGTGGGAASIRIDDPNLDIEFVESDQVAKSSELVVYHPPASTAIKCNKIEAIAPPEWPHRRPSWDYAFFGMLSLARSNLAVRLRSIDPSTLASDSQKDVYFEVQEMLMAPVTPLMDDRGWDDINKAEGLLALLYTSGQLRQEISGRLKELAKTDQAEAAALRREFEQQISRTRDPDSLRTFLSRILEIVHRKDKKKYLARPLRINATNRLIFCLLASFGLMIAPYLWLIWDYNADTMGTNHSWTLFTLYTAVTAGLFGAFFSRLKGIQRQWTNMSLDEMFLQRDWSHTLLRGGVGVCGALIVFCFLGCEFAKGTVFEALFPHFQKIGIDPVGATNGQIVPMVSFIPTKDLSLLMFWCFIAGFSETFVSRILKNTEHNLFNATLGTQPPQKSF
jgi:hypothetical protein